MSGTAHPTEPDWIEGLPLPREQTKLVGHADVARELHEAYRSGRMHHAVLLTGPKGIGKATLAFRFARFALSHPDPAAAPPAEGDPLSPVDSRVGGQVSAGAHPNILHLKRPYDEKDKKLKTVLTVDEVRRSVPFFGSSAGGRGYRIAIVDAADDMNPQAANALLKLLEEPPSRAFFLVLSHAPGSLLPTIRSRCRRMPLTPLDADEIDAAVTTLGLSVEEGDKPALAAISEGSVRRACELIESDGLELYRAFQSLTEALPALDRTALHRFAERAGGGRRGDATLGLVADLARGWLSERIRSGLGEPVARLQRY
ncbi:MAG TPA: DNA polymerase III subunit delta', partial [Methylomirabilota bacterium]|nr:DNA polymerase III subunit delta' [Methylomirabilota bacterium]